VAEILNSGQVCLLDGTSIEIDGVGFVGTKGFGGDFGPNLVQPFGEAEVKRFISTGIDEAVRLQAALSRMHAAHKLAVMHYSPIVDTLVGEPLELYPFLGCSRFAEAVDCAGADLVLHGHAHHGSPIGKTAGNIPVYNVSRYVKCGVTERPYCLIHLDGETRPEDVTVPGRKAGG
jgi:Icc-related predicted phosphoesterase